MANDSDQDYNPNESEEDLDDEIISESSRSFRISRTGSDSDNESDSTLENRTNTKLVQKSSDGGNPSFRYSQTNTKTSMMKRQYIYQCSFCYYQTLYRYSLKTHFKGCKQTSSKKLWECPKCHIKYTLETLLEERILPADGGYRGKNIFWCLACSFEADENMEVATLEKIHRNYKRPIFCPHCKIKVNGINTFKNHMFSEHSVSLTYKCEYCEFSTSELDNLEEHKKSHTDLQEMGLIQCSHCHFDFFTMNDVKEHMKKVKWEREAKSLELFGKEDNGDMAVDKDDLKIENKVKDVVPSELYDETMDLEDDTDMRSSSKTPNWQLQCTLCGFVTYSKTSCHGHIKNKHRRDGHTVVKFHKYYENLFKGTVKIGKVKDHQEKISADREGTRTVEMQYEHKELLKVLDWTLSEDEDQIEKDLSDEAENNEVITIQFASDTEDELDKNEKIELLQKKKAITDNSFNKKRTINRKLYNYERKNNRPIFNCKDCSYEAKNRSYLAIHEQLIHDKFEENDIYKCPQRHCRYTSTVRHQFRNHLKRAHKLKVESFYPKDLKCPDCIYIAKKPHHLLIHRTVAHKNRPEIDPAESKLQYPCPQCDFVTTRKRNLIRHLKKCGKSISTSIQQRLSKCLSFDKNIYKCTHCEYSTIYRSNFSRHLRNVHKVHETVCKTQQTNKPRSKKSLSCKQCGLKLQGLYQLAWHKFLIHKNEFDLRKWRLKCKLCNYENYSKVNCHRHGLQHNTAYVTFRKFYKNKLQGMIGFRYLCQQLARYKDANLLKSKFQHNLGESKKKSVKVNDKEEENINTVEDSRKVIHDVDDNSTKQKNKIKYFIDTPSNNNGSINVIECTNADDKDKVEGPSGKVDNNEVIKLNVDLNSDDKGKEIAEESESDEISLLTMKAEFFTCCKCTYETKHKSHIAVHEILVHGNSICDENSKYQCPFCEFKSRYRYNIKRHLMSPHKHKIAEFYAHDLDDGKNNDRNAVKEKKSHSLYCKHCSREYEDKYLRDWHMFKCHRDKTELLKWSIRCALCSYETCSKKNARNHGMARHGAIRRVKFRKYYKNKIEDRFIFKNAKRRIHHCNKCDYVTATWECLKQHCREHKKSTFIPPDEILEGQTHYRIKVNRRVKFNDLDSTSSKMHENSDTLGDTEINISNGIDENEIIRIEIIPDSDDETTKRKDSSQNDAPLKQKEQPIESKKSNYDFQEVPKPVNRHKADIHKKQTSDVATASGNKAKENKNEDPSGNYPNQPKPVLPKNDPVSNKCIHPGCNYHTNIKFNLKLHCIKVHKYNRNKIDAFFQPKNTYKCSLCKFQSSVRRTMSAHIKRNHDTNCGYDADCRRCKNIGKDKYQYAFHVFNSHGDKTELLKWRIQCTLCSYETYLKTAAIKHANRRHSSTTQPIVVKFHKFYKNESRGHYKCTCRKKKLYHCNKCDFVTGSWTCLFRHDKRHKKPNFIPQYQVFKKESKYISKGRRKVKKAIDSSIGGLNRKPDIEGAYSKQQILDIIGLNPLVTKDEEDNEVCTINNNKSGKLVDELNQRILLKNKGTSENIENNEVIMIEITSDNEEFSTGTRIDTGTAQLNPVTGELIAESVDEEQLSNTKQMDFIRKASIQGHNKSKTNKEAKSFKCIKADCGYSCDSLKAVTDHIKTCTHKNSRKLNQRFTCHLCEDVLTNRNSLQSHTNAHSVTLNNPHLLVSFSEITNYGFFCDIEIKANSDTNPEPHNRSSKVKTSQRSERVSYKCWMCGVLVLTRKTLQNHTNLHAREDDNLKLKVRYSKFRDEKKEGTIIMQADPNYVFQKKVKARDRSPVLEYDPSLRVFSCEECNFKTNEEEALTKHKTLHWTSEKDALFKAQKWFTCSVCFFHCFNAETFMQHGEWHKTHPTSTGSIGKLGLNSWFLK